MAKINMWTWHGFIFQLPHTLAVIQAFEKLLETRQTPRDYVTPAYRISVMIDVYSSVYPAMDDL